MARGEVWVITGPLFYDPDEENASTADGRVEYTILNGRVSVPTHFYKLVASHSSTGAWQFLPFVLENRGYPSSTQLGQFIVPVQWIQDRAGIDLVPKLPTSQAAVLSLKPTMWP
jgi:DNA/RNA endonuclease G (NUC1)